ncbi:MAG: PQQ-binding-like beta-propeller repeat protein, partial [Candidatus Bathyarchaeota archaeon]|nr:PQQ-binding-like beta-propeller repeat protein [Candidatus Bathyarchaeota archaeon]
MKRMENKKIVLRVTTTVLAILLISSTLMLLASSQVQPISPSTDYGDIMQYDWPQAGSDEGNTGGSLGPAPDTPDVLWKTQVSGSCMVSVFNGKAFIASGTTLSAYDALTGVELYSVNEPQSQRVSGGNAVQKLDDTYLLTMGSTGCNCYLIETGELVWTSATPNANRQPGSGTYFGGHYSTSMKMFFNHAYDTELHQAQTVALDISNPAEEPTIAWIYASDSPSELLCSGDGKVFLGSTEGEVYALNTEGERVWQSSTLGGIAQQSAIYYNGNLYTSAVSWQLTCFDGETGDMLWQAEKGIRAFSAYRGAAGAGIIFDATVELDPYGTIGAWDAETGERLWKQPAYFNIHYDTMAYADGKVYGIKCDRAAGSSTGGLVMPGQSTACWDAYTGTELWNLPGINIVYPSIAYGNLYGTSGGYLYCIGGEPADWTHGFIGNVENQRVAVGQSGPEDISTPRWAFQTGGDVFSSPAVVDGKVYFGSSDHNWYCLNAYTGEKIWNFTIDHYARSSVAVVGGKVYTGADDGYFRCLNAETGAEEWKTSAGGFFPHVLATNEAEPRSSPLITGNRMYAGALDGNVYCLDLDGNIKWTYTTDGPVMGSPSYADGVIYIASTDGYLYAINAASGTFLWKSFELNMDVVPPAYCEFYNTGTATVANGVVYIGGGVQYGSADKNVDYAAQNMSTPSGSFGGGIRFFAFDATTGESIWNMSRAGNTQPFFVPCYVDGQIYAGEFFELTSMDVDHPGAGPVAVADFSYTNRILGNRTWSTWVGYQIQSSAAYADDLSGAKVYIGSDIGSIYCLDATNGNTHSVFTAGGNVPCSPSIWEGKMYIGTTEGIMYCFDDSPTVDFNLFAAANKGEVMWNNETITIGGRLTANPMELVWEDGAYVPYASYYHPGLPNAEVQLSLAKPDGTSQIVTATTNQTGYFTFNYNPTTAGEWGWVIYYAGERTVGLTYNEAYGEYNYINVVAAPNSTPQTTASPTAAPTGTTEPTTAPTGTTEP